jgi:4a-hydroxytetrahydrobiopterin dehydratase
MPISALSQDAIMTALTTLPGWSYENGFISRDFRFKDFNEAFAFLTRIAMLSEKMNHHANWSGVYNQVSIRLQTHDAGGVTERDLAMARSLDMYAEAFGI